MANKNYLSIYAKSFNWAGFFLPNKVYLKCSALYDFCRVADNIADSNNSIDIKKKNFLNLKMILMKKTLMIQLLKIFGNLFMNLIFH